MEMHWWKNAVIYAVDVEHFCDSNADGIGDFPGLTSKLGYIADLGATCIWLLPFFPSTNRDNGYDISDYFRVDPRYGSFEEFLTFVRAAGERGLRVIVDLVAQHTSLEHPWFQAARSDASSPYRDYYVWSDHPPAPAPGKGSMFPGQEDTVWTFDERAGQFYYHRFYSFQPSLNHNYGPLRDELERILDFWLSFGIAGFRIDAASHMIEQPLDATGRVDESHAVLRHIYSHVTSRKPDAALIGEVDEDEHALERFFDGEQLNMMFNFFLNNYIMLALATAKAEPIAAALSRLPPAPSNGQWANFLRNLDEADLERLDLPDREFVLAKFAPEDMMRIYGRGIRRRLAPMLGGDPAHLKLAFSLLFSLPGAPLICYGDEIGMGEDLTRDGRNSVRIPMQWSTRRNGGFSSAPKARLHNRAVADGSFGFNVVNVERQVDDKRSLLTFVRKLAALRRGQALIGESDYHLVPSGHEAVLAHEYRTAGGELLMLHNLSDRRAKCLLTLDRLKYERARELLSGESVEPDTDRLVLDLEPYGARWFRWER